VNPEFPSPVTNMLACILTIEKAHPDVSQIRLDFFMFQVINYVNSIARMIPIFNTVIYKYV
jgi:hypothetical protein